MAVPVINIVFEQGADYSDVFTVNNPNGTPLDLSGYSVFGSFKKYPDSPISTPFTVGIVTAAGQVVLSVANTITSPLKSGRYYGSVFSESIGNQVKKLFDLSIIVNPSALPE
jgi:hypothetical protein